MSDPEPARRLQRNARREVRTITIVWGIAFLWTVLFSYSRGYPHSEGCILVKLGLAEAREVVHPSLVLGFPDWVFWGIVIPWLACTLFTVVYAQWIMSDDDLGIDNPEDGPHGH